MGYARAKLLGCSIAACWNEFHSWHLQLADTHHSGHVQAFDGKLNSKWLDFGAARQSPAWLEYCCMPNQAPATVTHYTLVSANDEPSRDPCDFTLEGCLDYPGNQGGVTAAYDVLPEALEGCAWQNCAPICMTWLLWHLHPACMQAAPDMLFR